MISLKRINFWHRLRLFIKEVQVNDAMSEEEKDVILRVSNEQGNFKGVTREELEAALSLIGWKIRKSGNGLNDFIENNRGIATSFVVEGNEIEIRKNLFGDDSYGGAVKFNLYEISISTGGDNGKTEYVSLCFTDKNYISFYNHD